MNMEQFAAFKAFKAGFEISAEGFNNEYMGLDDEWLECHFRRWKEGLRIPEPCGAEPKLEPRSRRFSPTCTRPSGHSGRHNTNAATLRYKDAPREWS